MSDIPSDTMVWIRVNGKNIHYGNENRARQEVMKYCIANKSESVLFYKKTDMTQPFGEMICFENENRAVWFALTDCDDRFPDTGCSEGPYSIDDDGNIN